MPELPEVEHGARILREAAVGRTIAKVQVLHPSYARTLPPPDADRLIGRVITDVSRRGKHQIATLDDGSALEIHFRMTGEWQIGRTADAPVQYARLTVDLDDDTRLVLADSRALGTARRHDAGALTLPPLGPEPLTDAFTPSALAAALARRRGPIKPALLDQRVVAGIGNIYAGEALWLARISPLAPASSLSLVQLTRLVRAIRDVLRRAPAMRYTARRAGSAPWRVYDREGQRCRRCGKRIRRLVQGGRSTYFCPTCQGGKRTR